MRVVASVLVVLALSAPASAQDSFKQVWVTQSDSGEVVRGRMVNLSPQSLTLLTSDNRRVDLPLDAVLRIEAKGDSLKNGALIGAAVFGGLMVLECQGLSRGSQCVTGIVLDAGLGALIGAGIHAMNGGRTTLYSRPAAAPRTAPGAGVQFRLRF